MYLSPYQTKVLSRVMAVLAEPHDSDAIRNHLGHLVLDLLGAQHYASYVWDEASQRFDRGVHIHMDPANLAHYESYYQFHDPITPQLQRHRSAVCVTEVLPQSALQNTEFFNDFLARDGLHWGVNLYAWSGNANIGDMRIWRDRHHSNFNRDDIALLNLLRPAFVAALERSQQVQSAAPAAMADDPLQVLSPREEATVELLACGLGDKDIARRLGIAVSTVRSHIDHAFRKLGVNNRLALVHKLHARKA